MRQLIILAIIGFAAQLIDGALGMAYGVTSTSMLLLVGLPTAMASATIHMSEVATTAASGISHIRFGNVDKRIVLELIIPGSVGAFFGAIFVSSLPGDMARPYVACFLFCLGVFVLVRFLFPKRNQSKEQVKPIRRRFLLPLGLIAGFADATGGGGWGPLTTPILLTKRQLTPRKVIGSVDTSEFAIALSATLGFLLSLGLGNIHWQWVIALMIGGVIAAPIAAWLVRMIPSALLGVLVGIVIILTNLKTLLASFPFISEQWHMPIYISCSLICTVALIRAIYRLIEKKNQLTA